jgi:hypothetical protein
VPALNEDAELVLSGDAVANLCAMRLDLGERPQEETEREIELHSCRFEWVAMASPKVQQRKSFVSNKLLVIKVVSKSSCFKDNMKKEGCRTLT